jgi:hypothetical protein
LVRQGDDPRSIHVRSNLKPKLIAGTGGPLYDAGFGEPGL